MIKKYDEIDQWIDAIIVLFVVIVFIVSAIAWFYVLLL